MKSKTIYLIRTTSPSLKSVAALTALTLALTSMSVAAEEINLRYGNMSGDLNYSNVLTVSQGTRRFLSEDALNES